MQGHAHSQIEYTLIAVCSENLNFNCLIRSHTKSVCNVNHTTTFAKDLD